MSGSARHQDAIALGAESFCGGALAFGSIAENDFDVSVGEQIVGGQLVVDLRVFGDDHQQRVAVAFLVVLKPIDEKVVEAHVDSHHHCNARLLRTIAASMAMHMSAKAVSLSSPRTQLMRGRRWIGLVVISQW